MKHLFQSYVLQCDERIGTRQVHPAHLLDIYRPHDEVINIYA